MGQPGNALHFLTVDSVSHGEYGSEVLGSQRAGLGLPLANTDNLLLRGRAAGPSLCVPMPEASSDHPKSEMHKQGQKMTTIASKYVVYCDNQRRQGNGVGVGE